MTLPNLFFIGGMRCGSTTVNLLLSQHPDIFMSPTKEPYFFIAELLRRQVLLGEKTDEDVRRFESAGRYRTLDAYHSLFDGLTTERIVGEASHYLYTPGVIPVIAEMATAPVRVLVSFRDPADRLVSEYGRAARNGEAQGSLRDFVLRDVTVQDGRIVRYGPDSKLGRGFQAQSIKPWIKAFGAGSIKWIFFDDIGRSPLPLAREIYEWLGVAPDFTPAVIHTQRGGALRRNWLLKVMDSQRGGLKKIKSLIPTVIKQDLRGRIYNKSVQPPEIDTELDGMLRDFYREDIAELESLTGRSLDHWKTAGAPEGAAHIPASPNALEPSA